MTFWLISSVALIVSPDAWAQADCPTCRTVTCRDQFGVLAASESLCPQPKPATGDTVQAGTRPWCPATVNHGICGSLSGATTPNTIAKGSQLCTNGAAVLALFDPSINGTGSRSRTCAGANGGDTVSCSTIGQLPSTDYACRPKPLAPQPVSREDSPLERRYWNNNWGTLVYTEDKTAISSGTLSLNLGYCIGDNSDRYNTTTAYNTCYSDRITNNSTPEDAEIDCRSLKLPVRTDNCSIPHDNLNDFSTNSDNGRNFDPTSNYTLYTVRNGNRYRVETETLGAGWKWSIGSRYFWPIQTIVYAQNLGPAMNNPNNTICLTSTTQATCNTTICTWESTAIRDGVCGNPTTPYKYTNTTWMCSVGSIENDSIFNANNRDRDCVWENWWKTHICSINNGTANHYYD